VRGRLLWPNPGAIETDYAKFLRGRVDEPAERQVLQQRAIAMQHNENGSVGLASLKVMQSDALKLDELSERRMTSTRNELEGDVGEHDRHDINSTISVVVINVSPLFR
jgi:hypothetical protein